MGGAGHGFFFDGQERRLFEPGTFLFAAAGRPHRFEDFTDDFAVWVVFLAPTVARREHGAVDRRRN